MSDDTIAIRELLEKDSGAMLLREMIGFAARRLIEQEIEARASARSSSGSRGCAMAATSPAF